MMGKGRTAAYNHRCSLSLRGPHDVLADVTLLFLACVFVCNLYSFTELGRIQLK